MIKHDNSYGSVSWVPVPGYEGIYEVSNMGCIYLVRANRVTWGSDDGKGYRVIKMSKAGISHVRRVHRVVAHAFMGERPPEVEVAHNNGIRHDNRLVNLRYATRIENCMDMLDHGTGQIKLSPKDVTDIRRRYRRGGVTQQQLADEYGVTSAAISYIITGKRWKHLMPVAN